MTAPEVTARCQHLQALEDALRFRRARAAAPCPGCGPGGQCPDHARDAGLIGEYERTARRLLHDGADAAAAPGGSRVMSGDPVALARAGRGRTPGKAL